MDAIKAALPDGMAHTVTSEIVTRRASNNSTANGAANAGRPRKAAAEPAGAAAQ